MCSYQASVFSPILVKTIKPETIINGFKKTGVCPLNKAAISIVPVLTPDDNMSPRGGGGHFRVRTIFT